MQAPPGDYVIQMESRGLEMCVWSQKLFVQVKDISYKHGGGGMFRGAAAPAAAGGMFGGAAAPATGGGQIWTQEDEAAFNHALMLAIQKSRMWKQAELNGDKAMGSAKIVQVVEW